MLALLRGPQAERFLRVALEDPRESVRNAALSGLFEIDAAGAVDTAVKALRSEDQTVRTQAARYLGKLKTPERKKLLRLLAGDDDPLVREGVASALGNMGERDMLPVLAGLAADGDKDVRAAVMGRMWSFRGEEPLDILSRGIEDVEWKVRHMAVYSLRRFDTDRALDLMGRVLHDDQESLSQTALKYIAGKRSPRAMALLLGALSNRHLPVRSAACRALESRDIAPSEDMRKALLARLVAEEHKMLYRDLQRVLRYRFPDDLGVKEAMVEEDRRRRNAPAKPQRPQGHPIAPRGQAPKDDVF